MSKKIFIIGAPGVGKTCLLERALFDSYSQTSADIGKYVCKQAVQQRGRQENVEWCVVPGVQNLALVIKDLRRASVVLLVVDITDEYTLDIAIAWRAEIKRKHPTMRFVLAVNKTDLGPGSQNYQARLDSLIERDWKVKRTSAKSNREVKGLFSMLRSYEIP